MATLKERNKVSWMAPILTILFGILFTTHNISYFINCDNIAFNKGVPSYALGFAALSVIFILYVCYAKYVNGRFVGLLCSCYIIALFGMAYQMLFLTGSMEEDVFVLSADFRRHCMFLILAFTVGSIPAYIIVRRAVKLTNFWYYGAVSVIVLMVGVIFFFAEECNGARISVHVGGGIYVMPGEFIKLLAIVLSAYSLGDRKRYICYAIVILLCCGFFVYQNDIGTTAVLFLFFIQTTYVVWDNKTISFGIMSSAAVGFVGFIMAKPGSNPYNRIVNTFNAMQNPVSNQQKNYLIKMVVGGVGGLGLEHASVFTSVSYAANDGSLAGIYAVFGLVGLFIVMTAFANLCTQAIRNRGVRSQDSIILFQSTCYIACHSIFNLLGAADIMPLTGVCAPLISSGGSSIVAFGVLIGMMAGSLHPKFPKPII